MVISLIINALFIIRIGATWRPLTEPSHPQKMGATKALTRIIEPYKIHTFIMKLALIRISIIVFVAYKTKDGSK